MDLSYVLPLRSNQPVTLELCAYLAGTRALAQLIVVDGSVQAVFRENRRRLPQDIIHLAPDPDLCGCLNGKVAGVVTGIRRCSHERVIIADDDVRYDRQSLRELASALDAAAIVRPQNYFSPLPWHARLDTARTLINRVTGGDWPGTLAVRRAFVTAANGYDGDVLFENLELVRTIVAAGGRELVRPDLYVRRLPPSTGHFWSQRVRQAYDEFARPVRLVAWLLVVPATAALWAMRGAAWALAVPSVLAMAAAEAGRRRSGGTRVFPWTASLMAPLWILERGLCAWAAVAMRLVLGGVRYRGRILSRAATPIGALRRRLRTV